MATLKAEKETTFRVDAYDLNDFVKEVTGKVYESQCYLNGGHDSEHRFNVNDKHQFLFQDEWDKFKKEGDKGRGPGVSTLLEGLFREGHIEEGIYYISVL